MKKTFLQGPKRRRLHAWGNHAQGNSAIPEDTRLTEVVSSFLEFGTRRLIVTDKDGRPVGLISDADAVMRVQPTARRSVLQALRGKSSSPDENVTAAQLMSHEVLTASPDTSLTIAAHRMLSHKRKWMVVVDENGKAIGLVDRQVLLGALAAH